MDEKQRFDKTFEELTPRRRQVLEQFLAGRTDAEIAKELVITETTVRKHMQNISYSFGLFGRSSRQDLRDLFAQYKPELLGDTPGDSPGPVEVPVEVKEPEEERSLETTIPITGVIPLNSSLYVEREADLLCREALQTGWSRQSSVPFLRIKGGRGLGKSSLLTRLKQWLVTEQKQVVGCVNLGGVDFAPEAFTDLTKLLYQFTRAVTQAFSSVPNLRPPDLQRYWRDDVAAASNCTEYLETHIFAKIQPPKTLIIDGIDKILGRRATQTPFLNLLRSWNESKMKYVGQPQILWPSLVVAASAEPYPHYEIADSPLQNVGISVQLKDFFAEQIIDLAKCYGLQLDFNQVNSLAKLTGGNPALLNEAMYQISHNHRKIFELIHDAPAAYRTSFHKLNMEVNNSLYELENLTRPFAYFLNSSLRQLQAHDDLRTCFQKLLLGQRCTDEFAKYQLELAGLIRGYPFEVQVSCELYREFFTKYFELEDGQ